MCSSSPETTVGPSSGWFLIRQPRGSINAWVLSTPVNEYPPACPADRCSAHIVSVCRFDSPDSAFPGRSYFDSIWRERVRTGCLLSITDRESRSISYRDRAQGVVIAITAERLSCSRNGTWPEPGRSAHERQGPTARRTCRCTKWSRGGRSARSTARCRAARLSGPRSPRW